MKSIYNLLGLFLLLIIFSNPSYSQCNSTTITFVSYIQGQSIVRKGEYTTSNNRSSYSTCVSGNYTDFDKGYKIDIPNTGELQISVVEKISGNYDYYDAFLIDKTGNCLTSNCINYHDGYDSKFTIEQGVSAGTYYLFIENASGSNQNNQSGFDIDFTFQIYSSMQCSQPEIYCGQILSSTTIGSPSYGQSIYKDTDYNIINLANGGASKSYYFVAPSTGSYTIQMIPQSDKDLELYLQSTGGNGCPTRLDCIAYSTKPIGQTESITKTLQAGEQYFITIDGWLEDEGTFTLSVTGPCNGGGCSFNTTNLDYSNLPFDLTNQAIGITNNYAIHSKAGCDFPSSGFDKIYKIVIPASNNDLINGIEISLKSSNNLGSPRLFVYQENCTGDFEYISNPPTIPNPSGSSNNAIQGIFLENGLVETTYYIVVEGNGVSTFDLRVDKNISGYISCSYPIISCGSSINSSITGVGGIDVYAKSYPPIAFCPWLSSPKVFPFNTSTEKFYKITPTVSGSYTFNLTNLSSDLELFLINLTCESNQVDSWSVNSGSTSESITYDLVANTDYIIVVDGYNGAQGSFTLSVTGPCSNSFCCYGNPIPTLLDSTSRNKPVGCNYLKYNYVGPGCRFKFDAVGLPTGSTIIQWCYRNINNPNDTIRFVTSSSTNTYTFPAGFGSKYEVCVKYKLSNGQELCCCKDICFEDPFACNIVWLRPIPTTQNYYVFDLINEPNAQDITWQVDTHPNIQTGSDLSYTVPLQTDYTVTVSWYDGICYKMCCMRICYVNPVTCGLAKPRPIPTNNNLYTLEISESNITDVRWEVDGSPTFNSSNVTYAPPFGGSGTYTIYVRYRTQSGCYKICCVKVCYAPPVNCNTLRVKPVPTSNGFYELESSDSGISDIKWEVGGNPNLTNTNLIYAPPFPVEGSYLVYARYKLSSGCYVVCCIKVCYTNPFNCNILRLIPLPVNNKYEYELNEPSASNMEWRVHETGETISNQLTFTPNNVVVGQIYNISVRYKIGDCYKVCCIKTCYQLPQDCNLLRPFPYAVNSGFEYQYSIEEPNTTIVSWQTSNGSANYNSIARPPNPPNDQDYTIYCVYKTLDNCYKICCSKVCYSNPVSCGSPTLYYNYLGTNLNYNFYTDTSYQNIKWYRSSNTGYIEISNQFDFTQIGSNSYTICCRYYEPISKCWRICCKTICISNPFECTNIGKPKPRLFNSNYDYTFELTENQVDLNSVEWQVDEHPNNDFEKNTLSFTPKTGIMTSGQNYTITVRYRTLPDGCYKICCKRICYEPFVNCSSAINISNSNGNIITVNVNNSFTDVEWYIENPGSNSITYIGSGNQITQTISSSGVSNFICRYRIPQTDCYKICLRPVNPCTPPTSEFVSNNINGFTYNFTNLSTGTNITYFWDFGNGQTSTLKDPTGIVYSQSREYDVCLTTTNSCGSIKKCQPINIILPKDQVTVDIDDNICAAIGSTVTVPVKVSNFVLKKGFRLDFKLSNTDFADFVDISSTTLSSLNKSINNGNLVVVWDEPSAQQISLPNGSTIFNIILKLKGLNNSLSSNIIFGKTDDQYFSDDNGNYVATTSPGSICLQKNGSISGKITTRAGKSIANVELTLSGGQSQTTITDQNGNYVFNNLPLNLNYSIKPSKDINYSNGIKVNDIVAIRNHILNNSLIGSYRFIAADVSNNKKADVSDIITIRNLILNNISDFPNVESWRFVSKSQVFTDSLNPFLSPLVEILTINNFSNNISNADFIGVKMGDVTEDNNPSNLNISEERNNSSIDFFFDFTYIPNGNYYNVAVKTRKFNLVTGLQFSVNWDSTILKFKGFDKLNSLLKLDSTVNFDIKKIGLGQLGLLWDDSQVKGVTLNDETVVFSFNLFVVGQKGASGGIKFSTKPVDIFVDSKNGILDFNGINSDIKVSAEDLEIENSIQIHPNPTLGSFSIIDNNNQIEEISLLDSSGKINVKLNVIKNNHSISELPSGIYYLKIITNNKKQIFKKLVKI